MWRLRRTERVSSRPRLDEATKLDQGPGWRLIVRPKCGEAVLTRPSTRNPDSKPGVPNPERSEAEAARRAQAAVRRLVCEHRLVRMWTLTMRDATTADERPMVVRRVQAFTRRCRNRWPSLRWLAVLEWHPGGHGWHVHMVVDRWVPKQLLADLWGWGFVDARRIAVRGDSTTMAATRKAAAYVAKYVSKDAAPGAPAHVPGDHRYLRPLGMTWSELEGEGTFEELLAVAWSWWPTSISWTWWSGDEPKWRGPKCLVLRSG